MPTDYSELTQAIRRLSRSNRWANIAVFIILFLAGGAVYVCAATFTERVSRDREDLAKAQAQIRALRRHAEAQDIAQVALLKWAASDHPEKDSRKLLEEIEHLLQSYREKPNAESSSSLFDDAGNASR